MFTSKIQSILFLILIGINQWGMAQDDCIVKLNEAEKLYEQGKIEKIPDLLSNCIETGFNKENKIAALRLLTLVNLFEDNQNKAEKTLLEILKEDPEFKINTAIDPVEFVRLYNSFNTEPFMSFGIALGLNSSKPRLIETYTLYTFSDASPNYSSDGIGFSAGFKMNYHMNRAVDISFEPVFTSISFKVVENSSSNTITTMSESMTFIDFPLFGSYSFYKYKAFSFYGELGMIYGMLITSKLNGQITYTDKEHADVEGASITTNEIRSPYLIQSSLGLGTIIKLNRSNLQLCLRYKYGLNNLIDPAQRDLNFENITSEYSHLDDDFSNTNFSFTISYNREFYLHNKKPGNKTNFDVIK